MMNRYFQEVLDAHELIRHWLGHPDASVSVYNNLLERFSADFSMVTPSGSQLNYDTLASFFRNQRGARKGLEIEIENLQLINESPTAATVTYQERQQQPGHEASLRFSTAVFEVGNDSKILWRHLHETVL